MFPSTPTPHTASSPTPASVQDRRSKPAGIVPRHLQTWVVIGIAVAMMGIIAISGPTRPAEKRTPTSAGSADAREPSEARIQEYRTRLDQETRRLAAAQAELDLAKRSLAPTAPAASEPPPSSPTGGTSAAQDSFAHERAERAYRALFADNVAFSLRKADVSTNRAPTSGVLPATPPSTTSAGGANSPGSIRGEGGQASMASPAGPTMVTSRPSVDREDGRAPQYTVLEGTIIEAVLTNRLDGSFAGPVNAMVTTAVYSQDRQHVVIPQGSRLLGEAKAVASFGQQRLAVAFHRLVLPDGQTVTLDQFKGLSQVGETGLQDEVNHHYAQLFGVSLAIGAIGGLAQANTPLGFDATAGDLYRQGVASSTAQSSLHILDRFLNVLPTVTIREGQRLKVYLAGDLHLPAYGASHD